MATLLKETVAMLAQHLLQQQKAVLVSIALAHARLVALSRGRAPLLLLDEIAAHLDAERRAALFDEVVALGLQCWMTGTDAELFTPLGRRAQVLRVSDGAVAAACGDLLREAGQRAAP